MKENEPDFALAVDIGATKMDAALIDAHGQAIGEIERHAVPFEGGVASLDRLWISLSPSWTGHIGLATACGEWA